MNLVMSQVEESIHIVDVTESGEALPPRLSHLLYILSTRLFTDVIGREKRGRDALCSRRWSYYGE
jgi:hypothetical protein